MKKLFLILAILLLAGPGWGADYFFGGDTTATGAIAMPGGDSTCGVDSVTTPAYSGNLDSGIIWMNANYKGPHNVSIVVYANDSTVLDSTAYFTVSTSGSRVRYSAVFKVGASIASGTKYFLGYHVASAGGTDGAPHHYQNTGAAAIPTWYKNPIATIPAVMTAWSKDTNNRPKAIGAFYSDAAAAVTKKFQNAKLGKIE